MYSVLVAPNVSEILVEYASKFAIDNGIECATKLVDNFDKVIISLQELPQRGVRKLAYIPDRYHIINIWPHLWLVYQIDNQNQKIYIDYLINDRSNYGVLFK